mgnify:CR=1 FL=1
MYDDESLGNRVNTFIHLFNSFQVAKMVMNAQQLSPRQKLEIDVKARMRVPSSLPPPESSVDLVVRGEGGGI